MQKQKYQLIIQTTAPSCSIELASKVRIMDDLAKRIVKKYGGTYDGNGVGFGGIDEYLYFSTQKAMELAANGIGTVMKTSDKFSTLRVSFWKKNLEEPMRKNKAGFIVKYLAKAEKRRE